MGVMSILGVSALIYTSVIALAMQSAMYYRPLPDYTGACGCTGCACMHNYKHTYGHHTYRSYQTLNGVPRPYAGTGGEAGMTKMRSMAVDNVPLPLTVCVCPSHCSLQQCQYFSVGMT